MSNVFRFFVQIFLRSCYISGAVVSICAIRVGDNVYMANRIKNIIRWNAYL